MNLTELSNITNKDKFCCYVFLWCCDGIIILNFAVMFLQGAVMAQRVHWHFTLMNFTNSHISQNKVLLLIFAVMFFYNVVMESSYWVLLLCFCRVPWWPSGCSTPTRSRRTRPWSSSSTWSPRAASSSSASRTRARSAWRSPRAARSSSSAARRPRCSAGETCGLWWPSKEVRIPRRTFSPTCMFHYMLCWDYTV